MLSKRLIVNYGPNPQGFGLLIITPGSAVGGLIEPKAHCSAGEVESAVTHALMSTVNMADGAKVTMDADKILVAVNNPRLENKKMFIYESLGTPLASLVASAVAEVLDRPVTVQNEDISGRKCLFHLKVVGDSL